VLVLNANCYFVMRRCSEKKEVFDFSSGGSGEMIPGHLSMMMLSNAVAEDLYGG
jgi:hypothetical protein